MEVGNYYLGIDAGTDSVGWAVTDNQYNVIRKKGKSLWGVRLFDGANTAQERRTFRTSRRRNERKKQRISLLQELFYKEICKLDPNFFIRLRDSSLWSEDKEEKQIYSLFNDKNFNDRNYHNNYKTIYHLRADLIKNKEKHDARLVYLAIHHIMKNRGHFLFNGNIESVTSFENTFNEFKNCLLDELEINLECPSISEFENILKDRTFKGTQKCKKLKELCSIPSSDKKLDNIFKLISGLKADLSIIFEDESFKENEHNKISFADSNYEETREVLNSEIQEKTLIIDIFNSIYNWVILSDILSGGEYNGGLYLSIAKVNTYNKHSKDLKILKSVIKKYFPQKYTDIFASNKENNYCSYIGMYKSGGKKYSVKKCSDKPEEFYKTIKNIINKNTAEEISNDKDVQYILSEIENNSFLPLQINKNNGVIPYQANKIELEAILKNAENYLPFLKEIDTECNKTTSEKIIDLFEFRIPYYVGPLNTSKGENAWMIRKEDGTIRPWNFEQKVDIDKTAAEFITRMTNQCTYLNNETVLPKYSLLYSEYTVLNEINNIRINGEKISVELKQDIFNSLFKNNKQVTCKKLLSHLNSNGYNLKKEDLSGFDGNFKSSLSSYIDLKNYIFGDDIDKPQIYNLAEKIILWITLYGDDSKLLKRVLQKNCSEQLNPEQIKKITKLKFKGWGRLSKVFLSELRGADCETGETMTIIEGLRNTQNNLMQLLSQNYTFTEECEKINSGYFINPNEISYDSIVKDIVASPSIKRSVWQTIQIVEEIQKVMGSKPRKIFVEMARGEEEKVRTTSRKQKLLDLGNVYSSKFTNNPLMWLKNNRNVKYSLNRMYDFNLTVNNENIWVVGNEGTQKTVNKYLGKNDILYTRYSMTNKGELFDQNPLKATGDKNKQTTLVPLKKGKEVWKYGGYNRITPSYFMLVESKDKKGNYIRTIETMPLYREKEFNENEELLLNYCKEVHELKEPKIILKCIKKNALLIVNGFPMHLKSSTGLQLTLQGAVQLILDSDTVIYLKKVIKFVNENNINKNKLEVTPYMKLSAEENIKLYDIFIQKLTTGIYSKRPANPVEKLINARDIFIELTVKEQCIVLSEILHLFQCKPLTSANLVSINLKKTVGIIQIAKNITAKNVKLVHQSPTGIYEYTVDLNKI